MDHLEKYIKRKPISLSDNELLFQNDFEKLKDGGHTARMAIWSYVENDAPIPNELKTILQNILLENFIGKKPTETRIKWNALVKEVAFHIVQTGDNQEDALEKVASDNFLNIDTLRGEYKKGKYRKLKDTILKLKNL